jgi:hypothetical protein
MMTLHDVSNSIGVHPASVSPVVLKFFTLNVATDVVPVISTRSSKEVCFEVSLATIVQLKVNVKSESLEGSKDDGSNFKVALQVVVPVSLDPACIGSKESPDVTSIPESFQAVKIKDVDFGAVASLNVYVKVMVYTSALTLLQSFL